MCRFTFPEGGWKGLTGFGIGRIRWNRAGRGAGDALRRGRRPAGAGAAEARALTRCPPA